VGDAHVFIQVILAALGVALVVGVAGRGRRSIT
jgi:hypothetical protein